MVPIFQFQTQEKSRTMEKYGYLLLKMEELRIATFYCNEQGDPFFIPTSYGYYVGKFESNRKEIPTTKQSQPISTGNTVGNPLEMTDFVANQVSQII